MSNLNKAWRRYLTLSWCLALSCLPFQQSDRGEGPRQHCGWQRCGEDESWTRSTKINSCLSCTYQLRNFWCHQSTFSVTTGQVWSVSLLTTSTIFQSNNFQGIIFVVTCVPDLDLDHLVVYFVSRVLMSTLMVEMKLLALESSRNLSRRHDLPTPESPTWNKHSCRQFSRILVNNTMNSADVSYSTSLLSTRSALFPTEADLVSDVEHDDDTKSFSCPALRLSLPSQLLLINRDQQREPQGAVGCYVWIRDCSWCPGSCWRSCPRHWRSRSPAAWWPGCRVSCHWRHSTRWRSALPPSCWARPTQLFSANLTVITLYHSLHYTISDLSIYPPRNTWNSLLLLLLMLSFLRSSTDLVPQSGV